jgi:hypothetical protein
MQRILLCCVLNPRLPSEQLPYKEIGDRSQNSIKACMHACMHAQKRCECKSFLPLTPLSDPHETAAELTKSTVSHHAVHSCSLAANNHATSTPTKTKCIKDAWMLNCVELRLGAESCCTLLHQH